MISNQTWKVFACAVNMGHRLHVFPFKMESYPSVRVVLVQRSIRNLAFNGLSLVACGSILLRLIYGLTMTRMGPKDMALAAGLIILFTQAFQINLYLNFDINRLVTMLNAIMESNVYFGKLMDVSLSSPDGVTWIMRLICAGFAGVTIAIPCVYPAAIFMKFPIQPIVFQSKSLALLETLLITSCMLPLPLWVEIVALSWTVYIMAAVGWTGRIGWHCGQSAKPRNALKQIYRCCQVEAIYVEGLWGYFLTCGYYLVILTTISISFCLIKYYDLLGPSMIIIMSSEMLVVLLFTVYLFRFFITLRNNSVYYFTSHLLHGGSRYRASSEDRAFWKSCTPIQFTIGNEFKIQDRNHTLKLYGNVILENLINALLTF